MKKSVLFLINGLGIEKQGSYSIAIDQCMPNLSKTKETSFFTTAFINSLEYRKAYESFFLGDTSRSEIKYMSDYIYGNFGYKYAQGINYGKEDGTFEYKKGFSNTNDGIKYEQSSSFKDGKMCKVEE